MPRKPIPEHLLTEKQLRDRESRKKNKKYFANYSKYYYLMKLLEDPEYNKKRWNKSKQKQSK